MKKLMYINAVRGYAILGVILVHVQKIVQPENIYLKRLADNGKYGVQLFYIASAFTLFLSSAIRKEQTSKKFFLRRFFRIAPIYYIAIAAYLFIFIDASNSLNVNLRNCVDNHISFLDFLSNITFLSSIHPNWAGSIVPGGITISVEVIFYLIFPVLFNKMTNLDTAVKLFILSIFLSFAVKILLNNFLIIDCERLKDIFFYNNIFNQFPVFLLGVISYFIIINKDFKLKSNTIFLLFTLVFIYSTWNIIITKFHIVSFSGLLFLFLLSKTRSKLLLNKIISLIGRVSYSAYLIHFIVIYYLNVFILKNNVELNFVSVYLFTVLITIIISYISHILIEKPFIRLGKKFT